MIRRFLTWLNRTFNLVADDETSARLDVVDRDLRALEGRDPLVAGVNALLCVCDDEWCFCSELVAIPAAAFELHRDGILSFGNNPCPECRVGRHVLSPGGVRA